MGIHCEAWVLWNPPTPPPWSNDITLDIMYSSLCRQKLYDFSLLVNDINM